MTHIIEMIGKMGNTVNDKWKEFNYDNRRFATVAEESLLESGIANCNHEDIYEWVITSKNFINQVNIDSPFGEPPLTVFANDRFYIEILFWLTGTTDIHQHGFRGVFYVLSGSSIHTIYQFKEEHRVNQHLIFGNLTTAKIELLEKGSYRRIEGGQELIHSLFHLEYPSISLVIRTQKDPENPVQYSYVKPHVAINTFYKDHKMVRQKQILKMLRMTNNPKFRYLLFDFVNQADLHSFLAVVIPLLFENIIDIEDEGEMLRAFETKHQETVQFIRPMFPEIRRIVTIQQGRKYVTDPVHRFFMALLMNATNRNHVMQIVSDKYPNTKPEELVFKWIQELNDQHKFNNQFDEFQFELLSLMLKLNSFEQILYSLRNDYDSTEIDDNLDKITNMYQTLTNLPLLKILFVH